ncbi:testis-specific zinc finger protein topi isoform X1 [Drosophila bipectinata]|uniref:testis-specific zinc finger protein topi isoform X1 n=1 Tax=Drosophila bipectinata TaxID=42026 RepID=UPI001C894E97|nr:testis-specific zinc finger protein topi isoform X1 [Drosophila bipectinata]
MSKADLPIIKTEVSGEYTLAEIEVDMETELNPDDLQPGATVLASNDGDGILEQIVSHEDLSKFFTTTSSGAIRMPTEVVVQRTLADPALKQILQEADGKPDFDPEAEQMKIRDFLAGVTNNKMTTEESVFQASRANAAAASANRVKCAQCFGQFDTVSIQSHICDPEERKAMCDALFGLQEKPQPSIASTPPAPPIKPGSERVIQENQIRLRRYMKDEMKYDLTTGIDSSRGRKSIKGPNECTMCDRKFVHASGLARHMEKHALDLIPSQASLQPHTAPAAGLHVVLKCNVCGRVFYDPQVALNHGLVHYPELPHITEEATEKRGSSADKAAINFKQLLLDGERLISAFVTEQQKANRLREKIFSTLIVGCVLQCEFCEYVFADISDLLLHSAAHISERRFECTACDISLSTAKEASVHFQTDCNFMRESLRSLNVSLSRFFVCNVCEVKFPNTDLLQEHRYASYHYFPRLSENRKRLLLPCEFCEANFEFAHEIQSHNEEKHLNKKKREKETRNTGTGRLRQYLCDICGKSYTQSSHLWQHLRFHQGVKPFVCQEENCDRKFTIRPDLNDHIRKCHTGERPYHCLVCGKRFLTGSVFYQHRLIHRGERRYECEECGKRFYRADALKNHQRIHTGEKPYSCLFCTKTFRQRGDRDKHIRARHAHLDANSRLMMQMQKFQLETAAALKAKQIKEQPGDDETDEGNPAASAPMEGADGDSAMDVQYGMSDQPEAMVCVPIDEFNSNNYIMQHYVEGMPMEADSEQQQLIVYNNPTPSMISIFDPEEEQPEMQKSNIVLRKGGENAKVVVVKNDPSQPLFADSYM